MSSSGAQSEQGSLLPSALVGLGILAIVGVFIFWPAGDGNDTANADGAGADAGAKGGAGGALGTRPVDPAGGGRAASAANRRAQGLAAPGEVDPKPMPKTLEGRIEAKRRELELAEMKVGQIEAGLERYPKIREEALANTDNVDFTTKNFDRKKERMELNLERAKADVETFTAELEELESEG